MPYRSRRDYRPARARRRWPLYAAACLALTVGYGLVQTYAAVRNEAMVEQQVNEANQRVASN